MKHATHGVDRSPLRLVPRLMALAATGLLASCATLSNTGGGGGDLPMAALNHPAVKQRNEQIRAEPPGNYYIGRRWWTNGTRFWGYLRRPGQPWSESKLVIMNESITKQPDRVPETGMGRTHGYDHNYEYRIWGSYTGKTVYDPNSNFVLPEFRLSRYELISQNPGFLFWPGETYSPKRLPPKHPPIP